MNRAAAAPSDVLVLGAGLAGSTVARRLCAAGARVALVGARGRPGIEGVSARARALLLEEGIDAGLLAGPVARAGHWGNRAVEGQEWLVRRENLAAALSARAQAAGANLHQDPAARIEREGPGWRVILRSGRTLCAPVIIEARGRGRSQARGPSLLALGRRYCTNQEAPAQTHIEVADFGWCWWVRGGHSLWLQIIAAPRTGHPGHPRGWAEAAAAQIPALARALEGARPQGRTVACAAQVRLGRVDGDVGAEAASGLWRAGDAAVALDPLSGQGIYQALVSARRVVSAILVGGDALRAQRAVAEWHAAELGRCARQAAAFYRENSARGSFWGSSAAQYEALARMARCGSVAASGDGHEPTGARTGIAN